MSDMDHFQIRPSQVTRTFGPGSIYDNQRDSMIIMGLDYWQSGRFRPVRDELLLREIGKKSDIDRLVSVSAPKDSENPGKVPVRSFPTWGFCPICHKLVRGRDYRTRSGTICDSDECTGKERGATGIPKTYPVRFVAACTNGHLDEFPWYEWVHRTAQQRRACHPEQAKLYLKTNPKSMSIAANTVECRNCNAPTQGLGSAMSKNGLRQVAPGCTRRRPWLDDRESSCEDDEGNRVQMKGMFKGSTNMYFPLVQSAITIPPFSDELAQKISADGEEIQRFRREAGDFNSWLVTKFELKSPTRPNAEWGLEDALRTISRLEDFAKNDGKDIRKLEFDALNAKSRSDKEFVTERIECIPPRMSGRHLSSAVVVKKARVVSALSGFTRLDPPDPGTGNRIARIAAKRLSWLPVLENRCEGIFLGFDSAALDKWEMGSGVEDRFSHIVSAPGEPPAGQSDHKHRAKYIFLHTLSHLTMRMMAGAAGYSIASFTERIYCGDGMAGILIFTSSPSSDGALGGVAELGRGNRPKIWPILDRAMSEASRCSCDPLCSSREPAKTSQQVGAACHACVLLPEPCCENMNALLDRAMVGETLNRAFGFLAP